MGTEIGCFTIAAIRRGRGEELSACVNGEQSMDRLSRPIKEIVTFFAWCHVFISTSTPHIIPIYFKIGNHDCCFTVIKMWGLTLWRNLLSDFFFFFPSSSVDVVWTVLPPGIACLPEGSKTQQEMQHWSTTCCMRQEDEQIHTLTWENIKWQTWMQYQVFKYWRNWINRYMHDYAFFPVFLWQSYGKLVSIYMKV